MDKHPLHRTWTLWYDSKKTITNGGDWEASLVHINTVDYVEDFWVMHNHTKRPSQLDVGANYHFFRKGIKPMWEDSANTNGGKWVFTVALKEDLQRLDQVWENMLLAAIGEYLDEADEICGLVLGKRKTQTKVAVWTSNNKDIPAIGRIGQKIREEAPLGTNIVLEYFPHRDGSGAEFPAAIMKL